MDGGPRTVGGTRGLGSRRGTGGVEDGTPPGSGKKTQRTRERAVTVSVPQTPTVEGGPVSPVPAPGTPSGRTGHGSWETVGDGTRETRGSGHTSLPWGPVGGTEPPWTEARTDTVDVVRHDTRPQASPLPRPPTTRPPSVHCPGPYLSGRVCPGDRREVGWG